MRLWTIHPKHLDSKGLVALWREALLAQAVLMGRTRGYTHHPQLRRFQKTSEPVAALASYLQVIHAEAERRGYSFQATKIAAKRFNGKIPESRGQLLYEWTHLKRKLCVRDKVIFRCCLQIEKPAHHPLFRLVKGKVRDWEKVRK